MKKLMYLDLFYIKIPRALRFRDKLSMINSIELRPPFLDDDLVCSIFKLNQTEHFNNGYGKWYLRKCYENIIQRGLEDPNLLSNYGIILFELGYVENAIDLFKKSIKKYP